LAKTSRRGEKAVDCEQAIKETIAEVAKAWQRQGFRVSEAGALVKKRLAAADESLDRVWRATVAQKADVSDFLAELQAWRAIYLTATRPPRSVQRRAKRRGGQTTVLSY